MKRIAISVLLVLSSCFSASAWSAEISDPELVERIALSSDCQKDQIHLTHVEHFDFTGDGEPEAVVTASTCNTGTAGPDVHAVYTRDTTAPGRLRALKIPEPGKKQTDSLFGNPNYELRTDKGALVAVYVDNSGRKEPLKIRYRWKGGEFVVDTIEKAGIYKTSFACLGAAKEVERAICHVEALAKLDLELAHAYSARLKTATSNERTKLVEEQKKWVAMRDSQCVIYKWWVECLDKVYHERIEALRAAGSPS